MGDPNISLYILIFDNIFTVNMLGIWENGRRGGFTSDAGMFLPSELFLQYRCFSKTDDNDRKNKNKMMQIPYLNI